MYEAYFGFREKPFNLTPDPKFLYLSPKHDEAFAHLEFGLERRGGFMVVTGEVGTGKTTLCRYFLDRLDENTVSAFILYPALGTTDLLRAINRDLGVPSESDNEKDLIDALHAFLLDSRREGKNIVLVIDEAQNLSRDVLEQVRLISNLETDTEKLIQIVLIGQSELNDLLAQRDLRQLAQRVTARYHLTPLSRAEMTRYIRHRLAVAGGIGKVELTKAALRMVHRYSKGVPRLINLVCDRALLGGYVLEQREIGVGTVRLAVKELGASDPRPWYRRLGWGMTGLLLATGLAIAGLALASSGALSSLRPEAFPERSDAEPMSKEELREHFELRLGTLSNSLSPRAASAALLERWGIPLTKGLSALTALEDMPSLAKRHALQYAELETSLAQLQALDLPAVLEVSHPSGDGVLYVTLARLGENEAVVYFAPGDDCRLPLDVLKKYWTGRASLFWKDFDEVESEDVPSRLSWARERLQTMGILPDAPKGAEIDAAELQRALKSLQQKMFLAPTGRVEAKTQMAIYSLAGGYRMPHLDES